MTRDEAQSTHWMAITFQNEEEYITIGNVHMPASWAKESTWFGEMAKIRKHSEEATARSGHQRQGLAEIWRPTLRWRHPGGRIIEKVVGAAFCTAGAWSWRVDDEPRRSDHSRKGFHPRRAANSRPWVCR